MAEMVATRVIGPTYAISVAATQTTAIAVLPTQSDNSDYAEFYNSGATEVCVVTAPIPPNGTPATPALVFPVAGTPTVPTSFILPKNMVKPLVHAVPGNGFSVSCIGSGAGPSIIYITPIAG